MKRILVVNDKSDTAKFIDNCLVKQDYQVEVVSNINWVYTIAYNFYPDVIIMDENMGGVDATLISKELYNFLPFKPEIIILSGLGNYNKMLDLTGKEEILNKPFTKLMLMAKINKQIPHVSIANEDQNFLKMVG